MLYAIATMLCFLHNKIREGVIYYLFMVSFYCNWIATRLVSGRGGLSKASIGMSSSYRLARWAYHWHIIWVAGRSSIGRVGIVRIPGVLSVSWFQSFNPINLTSHWVNNECLTNEKWETTHDPPNVSRTLLDCVISSRHLTII